MPVEHHITNI